MVPSMYKFYMCSLWSQWAALCQCARPGDHICFLVTTRNQQNNNKRILYSSLRNQVLTTNPDGDPFQFNTYLGSPGNIKPPQGYPGHATVARANDYSYSHLSYQVLIHLLL